MPMTMSDSLVPSFDAGGEAFEQVGQTNGSRFWHARSLMTLLGYENFQNFEQAINRAIGTCSTLGISVVENFEQCEYEHEGATVRDFKLSRFACYLVAMNGDVRKPAVAAAQAYFATLAEAARLYMQATQDVERVQIRDDISEREKGLTSAAKRAGVTDYGLFQNAGYRGMYNMHLSKLKTLKGLPSGCTLLDFMDKRELAGNLFRLTETEARLKVERVHGQRPAEDVAFQVGRKVRNVMRENGGQAPEHIPLSGDIKEVRKGLKETAKEFTKLDTAKSTKSLPKKSDSE
jgi:DNA-damage-inducible protein D